MMKRPAQPVRWVRLGDYIEPRIERNSDLRHGPELIEGVDSSGTFCKTKADTTGIDMKPYKVVRKGDFAYNPSRINLGSLALRESYKFCIVSHLYVVFHVRQECEGALLPEYLLVFFRRKEFYRLVEYLNYGSQRPEFGYRQMSDILIPLPDIDEQRRFVAAWRGLRNIKEQNEALAEPLLALCQSRMEELKKRATAGDDSVDWVALGEYIEPCDERNTDGRFGIESVRGISIEKKVIPTKADMTDVSLNPYKVLHPHEFCFVTITSRNGGKISLAENDTGEDCIVSSSYEVFKTKIEALDPTYLYLWFCRPEFDRYARFHSWGSAREAFSMDDMKRVRIPLPRIEEQKRIVAIYEAAREAKRIAEEAGKLSEAICPALMRRAAEAAT